MEFIYKNVCIYSYMFKLQLPSKYSPFDAIHLSRLFFHCSKQFSNSSILMPFSAFAIFFLTSSTSVKHLPLRTFFIRVTITKKVGWGETGLIGRVGPGGHAVFVQNLLNTQRGMSRCARKLPSMKWTNALKESSKKSLRLDVASHNASWYTDTDGFLD